jgi:hypothetical protein
MMRHTPARQQQVVSLPDIAFTLCCKQAVCGDSQA